MKLKAKIDPQGDIVALSLNDAHPDFPDPPEISDNAIRGGFQMYTTLSSPLLRECRRSCFCVLAHGTPTEFSGANDQESLGWILTYYQTYGRGRQLLLLSCLAGLHLARQLTASLRVDVIAVTGIATLNSHGQIWCIPRPPGTPGADDRPNSALNWGRLKPTGEIIMAGSEILTEDFVRPK